MGAEGLAVEYLSKEMIFDCAMLGSNLQVEGYSSKNGTFRFAITLFIK